LDIQAQIPSSLCAIHNFIRAHDPDPEGLLVSDSDNFDRDGYDEYPPSGIAAGAHGDQMSVKRDQIAQEMWEDYQHVCRERGIDEEDPFDDNDDDDELDVAISDDII
jgi:hypothetical protein